MKRNMMDKARENLRLQQVYNVFSRYLVDELFNRWAPISTFRHRMQKWVWQLPEEIEPLSPPVKVRLMLEELGPTYVKMGQIVSSQASVIPDEWEMELEKLQSDVPPFPGEWVADIILEELGAPPETFYSSIQLHPFAAASTAQVHQALLHDGTPVVPKVQRPHIQNQMKADLGIMQNAARVASRRSEALRAIDLEGMLEEFSSSVLRELDYTGEAYNALRLGESMAQLPGVSVPFIYSELSTSRLMTMEYIHGVKISDVEALDAAGIDRQVLAKNTLRALVKQLLIDGFFHADPHPGNILVNLDDGNATFIDTGMVGELELTERMNLIQLLMTMQNKDVQGMAQVLFSLSDPFVDQVDEKAYYRDFQRTVGRFMAYGQGTSFGTSVNVALGLLREHGLRLEPQLTMAVKAMMQAEAVTTVLYPEGGIMAEGVPMIKELALEVVTPERIKDEATKQASMAAREVFKRLPTNQEATVRWLDQYQKGRFEVTIDTSELAEEVDKLAYFDYIFAMIVAILIVFKLVWDWLRGKPPAWVRQFTYCSPIV